MIDWTSVAAQIGSTAVVVGALAWVAKATAQHWLARNVENYKNELARDSEREMEGLRHALHISAVEHDTVFAELQAKRSAVVAGVYERLVTAEECVELYIDPRLRSDDVHAPARYEAAFASLRDLNQYLRRNRIYLQPDLCNQITELFKVLHEPAWGASFYHVVPVANRSASVIEEAARREAWTKFKGATPPVMNAIETEFRRLLGVQVNQSTEPSRRVAPRGLHPDSAAKEILGRKFSVRRPKAN